MYDMENNKADGTRNTYFPLLKSDHIEVFERQKCWWRKYHSL